MGTIDRKFEPADMHVHTHTHTRQSSQTRRTAALKNLQSTLGPSPMVW